MAGWEQQGEMLPSPPHLTGPGAASLLVEAERRGIQAKENFDAALLSGECVKKWTIDSSSL
ncbi:MAG TPA: hypothetical protein VNX25_01140, partial [Verrucomicrobiae bacterium]|nr:hypothetical protein [Verrucomicrobiae bacterium]